MDALADCRPLNGRSMCVAENRVVGGRIFGARAPWTWTPWPRAPRNCAPWTCAALSLALLLSIAAPLHAAERVLALTTDWSTGGVTALSGEAPFTADADLAVTCGDAVGRFAGGLLYVVNRLGCDNIEVLDPANGWAVVSEFSVGAGSNPQDIAVVSATRAYVSRYESNWLYEVDPSIGAILDSLSLAALADTADGLCEMHRLFIDRGRLFIEVQRLDRGGFPWTPVPPSYLAVVDLAERRLIDTDPTTPGVQAIALAGTNPIAPMQMDPATGELLVPEGGAYDFPDAAGIERVDPVALRSNGFLITEEALGGNLTDFAIVSDSLACAVVADAMANTSLVAWNPQTGTRGATIYAPGGYVLFDCLATSSGLLYVADQTYDDPGVRVFDARTGEPLSQGAVRTGRPPFELLLWEESAQETARVVGSDLGRPFPNPSRGRFELAWPQDSPWAGRLLIYDARGRLVRRLAPAAGAAPPVWDGLTEERRAAPNGAYFFRIETADGRVLTHPAALVR